MLCRSAPCSCAPCPGCVSRRWSLADLPQLWPLQHLSGLTDLTISGCNCDSWGPAAALPWLTHLKQLRALRLGSMHLLPPTVEALRFLSAATFVDVGISEDAGQVLPASLAHLSELRSLTLKLAGGVDLAAARMTELTWLTCVELSELYFQARGGPISGLSTLPMLETLSLGPHDFDAEVGVHSPSHYQPSNLPAWQPAAELTQQGNHACVDAMPRRTLALLQAGYAICGPGFFGLPGGRRPHCPLQPSSAARSRSRS